MRYRIGICHGDYHYVINLMEFVNSYQEGRITLIAFSSPEAMREYLGKHYLDGVLLGDDVEIDWSVEGVSVLRLTEKRKYGEAGIYKYQSGEAIAGDILRCLKVSDYDSRGMQKVFFGVYSPLGRCGKTGLAKGLCYNSPGSLYIAMEEYGRRSSLGEEILYNLIFQNNNILKLLSELKDNRYGFREVTGILSYQDIRHLKKENISWLRELLMGGCDYSRVVFDIGAAALWSIDILGEMDRVYVPVLEDEASGVKLQAFRQVLTGQEYSGVSEKLVYLNVPDCGFATEQMKDFIGKGEL